MIWTARQNRDIDTLAPQKVTQVSYVLLDTAKVWEIALGYDADSERAHEAFCSLAYCLVSVKPWDG